MKHTYKTIIMYFAVMVFLMGTFILVFNEKLFTFPSPEQVTISQNDLGKTIYDAKCVSCHGIFGKGDGFASSALRNKPRNFIDGKFKIRTTESGSIPTDEDVTTSIVNGLHGSAMPDWGSFIKGDSLKAVVTYVKSLSYRFQSEQPKPVKISPQVATSEKSIANGKDVFAKLQCGKCHGEDGKANNAVATDLKDDWGNPINAANLTEPWTFKGGGSAKDIYLRFRTGMDGTPMPSYLGAATESEMWDLANYVVSLGRKPVWDMGADEVKRFYATQESTWKQNPVSFGKYLVESRGCIDCHSPLDDDERIILEYAMAGGQKWVLGPYGEFTTPNLTSDKETGLGNWSYEEFKNAFTRGIKKDGSRMLPFPMPWTAYVGLKDDEIKAIYIYLQSLPPVYNKIPAPKPLGTLSYFIAKFNMLIVKKPFNAYIIPGNGGTSKSQPVSNNTTPNNSGKENQ